MKGIFENYFYLSGAITFILMLYLLKGTKRKGPSLLKMKRAARDLKVVRAERDLQNEVRESPVSSFFYAKKKKESHSDSPKEYDLNVIFMYNGEEWDAYQILGVPAGCSLEDVEEAFREQKSQQKDLPKIVEVAYEAIKSKVS